MCHTIRRHIIRTVKDVQYGGRCAVQTCHTISMVESVQYMTAKTAQGVVGS